MENSDDKTQMFRPGSTWILSAADGSIGDTLITPKQVVTIGRQTGCDIVIQNRYISRRHAEVFVRDDRLFVKDLQSTHGTLVNGQPVTECALQAGDEIRFDKAVFNVQQLGGAPAAAADDADGKTVIRKLDDVRASMEAAAAAPAAPPPAPVAAKAPPAPEPVEPRVEAPPPRAEAQPAATEPPAALPPQHAPAADPTAEPAQEQASRSKNWWDPQEAGPMGTRLVKVADAVPDMPAEPLPQVHSDRPMLIGITPEFRDQQFELKPGKLIVGKKSDADIRIVDEYVSDVHAQIVGEGERWKVVNILSANGTFVNGKKVQAAYLRSGDVLRFGRVDFQFVDSSRKRGSKLSAGTSAETQSKRGLWIGVLGFVVTLVVLGVVFFVMR